MDLFSHEINELFQKANKGLTVISSNPNHYAGNIYMAEVINEIKSATNEAVAGLNEKATERLSQLIEKFNDHQIELRDPIGAICDIKFLDDGSEGGGHYISFLALSEEDEGYDTAGVSADNIFYHASGESGIKSLMEEGAESFVVLDYKLQYENPQNNHQSKPRI